MDRFLHCPGFYGQSFSADESGFNDIDHQGMKCHGENDIGPHDHGQEEAHLSLKLHIREEIPCDDWQNDR